MDEMVDFEQYRSEEELSQDPRDAANQLRLDIEYEERRRMELDRRTRESLRDRDRSAQHLRAAVQADVRAADRSARPQHTPPMAATVRNLRTELEQIASRGNEWARRAARPLQLLDRLEAANGDDDVTLRALCQAVFDASRTSPAGEIAPWRVAHSIVLRLRKQRGAR